MNQTPMTREGYTRLQEELDRLKKVERAKNIQDIAEARAHGDLSENAEYHAAKEKQSFIEGRIKELEAKLSTAIVVSAAHQDRERVTFGATVSIRNGSTGEEKVYTIVGQEEVDLKRGRISVASPVGKALVGRKVGESVLIRIPAGEIEYEVCNIVYDE
ncbi:MAG: transcription elongation factor GreA [Nitrospirae bacterium]|nr:transcription elongation factor GreA [Nitrospirota bacterium]